MKKEELIQKLINEPLFKDNLKEDISNGDIFLAFREDRIDLYHKGGKLFSFGTNGFSTHKKYASVIKFKNSQKEYVTEEDLGNATPISAFSEGIVQIKENCKNYAGVEAEGVSEIYSKYSCLNSNENIVVLDIEKAFKSLDEGKTQDRIDILLLDKKNKTLVFVEAKHFSNKELWSTTKPKVIEQIERYEKQIKQNKDDLLKEYSEKIKLLNEHFKKDLPFPEKIDDKVILLIFGFGIDDKKGRLTDLVINKEEYKDNSIYPIGDVSKINLDNLIKKTSTK